MAASLRFFGAAGKGKGPLNLVVAPLSFCSNDDGGEHPFPLGSLCSKWDAHFLLFALRFFRDQFSVRGEREDAKINWYPRAAATDSEQS